MKETAMPDHVFTHDTRQSAAQLDLSPREVMKLARTGKLLFRFVAGKYQCPQADIDSYQREMTWRQQEQLGR